MGEPQFADQAMEQYGRLQQAFESQGGYTYETRIRQTLTGLGFDESDYRARSPVPAGSVHALLARLLLNRPAHPR
jgi:ATP-binding cassette subfamily F protein 3